MIIVFATDCQRGLGTLRRSHETWRRPEAAARDTCSGATEVPASDTCTSTVQQTNTFDGFIYLIVIFLDFNTPGSIDPRG